MTLGYCILHANRIDAAFAGMHLDTIAAEEGIDMGLGALSLRHPERLITDYLDGVARQARAVLERMQQAFANDGGLFGDLRRWIAELGRASFDEFRLTPWVDRLADLFALLEPAVIAGKVDALLERIAIALPELSGGGLLDRVLGIALGGLDVLERRRLDGHDDLVGHRTFRMARIVRFWLGEALADVRSRLADFDLVAVARRAIAQLFGGRSTPEAGFLRGIGEQLRTKIRPFAVAVDALLAIRVSVQVNANAQTLPEPGGLWLDDNLTVPHDYKHPLWWLDLSGSIASLSFTIVDVQRFNPFYGPRAGDAILSVINLAWQTVRGIVRAVRPDFLIKNHSTTGAAFFFSELGDLCIQFFLNLLGSFHEAADHASNWVMSLACRLARWFTFSLQPRMPYMFARAIWYLRAWKEQAWIVEHEVRAGETIESIATARTLDPVRLRIWNRIAEGNQPSVGDKLVIPVDPPPTDGHGTRARFSFARHAWNTWMWLWLVGAINGICQSWEDMQLNDLGDTDFVKVGLWLGPLIGALAAIFLPPAISEGAVWPDIDYEIDKVTFGAFCTMLGIVILMVAGSMASTNATKGVWWIMVIVLVLAVALLFVPVGVCWDKDPPDVSTASGFMYAWMLIAGVIVFGLLTTILWWIYIDDGRDKEGKFTGLNPDSSPYKLPWRKGDVWVCGQGFHGIFSHYRRQNSFNHYGYDFLEGKNEPALAARGGLLVTVRQCNDYGSSNQNDIAIQHLDWAAGHDPGTEDERVQTYSHYIHIGPHCARLDIDQYVVQGQNVVDIDSTGMSAQHHVHFGAMAVADSRWQTSAPSGATIRQIRADLPTGGSPARNAYQLQGSRPVIFKDPSLRRDRTNPVLRWIPGHVHHPGRPLAQCLYQSDNEQKPGPARPIVLDTASVSPDRPGSAHRHRLEIDVEQLLAGATLWTTFAGGHRHQVNLSADQRAELLRHAMPAGWKTEVALTGPLQHDHAFEAEPFTGGTRQTLTPGVILQNTNRADSPIAHIGITAPPPAQLVARKAGPYDLLGQQMVFRVDDRRTEMFGFGGHRAMLLGDVAIGRAPRSTEPISIGIINGSPQAPATTAGRHSVRAGLAQLDEALLANGVQVRAVPVLILETRARGNAAELQLDGAASSSASFGIVGAQTVKGSGALAQQRSITQAQLQAIFTAALNDAPVHTPPTLAQVQIQPTPAGPVHGTDFAIDGNAVTVASSQRIGTIFSKLYDTPNKRLVGEGPLPSGAGRATLSWGAPAPAAPPGAAPPDLEVPIAGTAAALEIDPAAAWLGAGHLAATPLRVKVGATEWAVHFAGDTNVAAIASRLMHEIDGIRAWDAAGKLWIETVDFGADVALEVRKAKPPSVAAGADFTATKQGEAPPLDGAAAIRDSASIDRAELIRLVLDATKRSVAAAARPAAITAGTKVRVTVDWHENRLRLTVPVGKVIELDRGNCSQALLDALAPANITPRNFENPSTAGTPDTNVLLSRALPEPIALPVGGWLDVRVDGDLRRVHLDAEPARFEFAPVDPWPAAAAARLRIKVGTSPFVDVNLDGKTSLAAIADAIASAGGAELLVRTGYRVAVEARASGRLGVQLPDTPGRSAIGFLTLIDPDSRGRGPAEDLHRVASDAGFQRARDGVAGALVAGGYGVNVTGTVPNQQVAITATDRTVQVNWTGVGADPFGFASGSTAATSASAFSVGFAERALGGRVATYRVDIGETGGGTIGARHVEISANPAIVRGTSPVSPLPLSSTDKLRVTVTWPTGVGTTRNLTSEVDFSWASELLRAQGEQANLAALEATLRRRMIDQLQRELPLVEAWLFTRDGTPGHVHLQTKGAGTEWKLRLEGNAAIAALGFDPDSISGGAITVQGIGNVPDEQRVTPDQLRQVFVDAAAYTTFSGAAALYDVTRPTGQLKIAAPDAAITLVVEPEELDHALPRSVAGNAVIIDASAPFDLPSGRITIQRAGQPAAAVFVYGSPAQVRSASPLPAAGTPDERTMVDALKNLPSGQQIEVEADGTSVSFGRFPTSVASLEDVVAHMATRAPRAHVALRSSTSGTGRDLVIESRRRGSSSRVALRFVGGLAPTLGFTSNQSANGSGSFPDLANINAATMLAALENARGEPAVAQSLLTGRHDAAANVVELRAADATADLNPVQPLQVRSGPTPAFAPTPPRLDLLTTAWPSPRELMAGVATFEYRVTNQLVGAAALTRFVHVPIWANPAQWELGIQPSSPSAFNDRRLALTVDGQAYTVQFRSPGSWAALAAQIERQTEWKVRAQVIDRINPTRRILQLSTASEGADSRLILRRASGGPDARDQLDDPSDAVAERRGRGPLPRLDRVEGSALAAALGLGFTVADTQRPASQVDVPNAWWNRYRAGSKGQGPVLRLRSSRPGCASTIVPIAIMPVPAVGKHPFDFDRSLQRGPACRAAVMIPAGAALNLTSEAILAIEFDENGTGAAVSPVRRVEARIPAGAHTREQFADRLHAALFGAGAGLAGHFPDGTIVVETLTPGLAGSVRLPVNGSSAEILNQLALSDASPLVARGWPGAGEFEDPEAFRTGTQLAPTIVPANALGSRYMPFRGLRATKTRAPTANVEWIFYTDVPSSPTVFSTTALPLRGEWTAADVAREVDARLGQATNSTGTTRRIGHAKLGADQTVQIEAMENTMLVLGVKPVGATSTGPLGIVEPTKLGERDDITPEPGYDLRVTDTLRTYRLVYDTRGAGDVSHPDEFVDAGWLRPPTDHEWGTARDFQTYMPNDVPSWARGRYLLAARAEAAKHDYGVNGEMIASFGQGTVDGQAVHFVRIARYWMSLTCLTRWNLLELWSDNGEQMSGGFANTTGLPGPVVHAPLCVGVRGYKNSVLLDWLV